jgi:hypothetical protein
MTIDNACFERAVQELTVISYTRTCALSCNESSVLQKLSLGFDKDRNATVLIGALQGPIVVLNHDVDQVRCIIEGGSYELASKVCLFQFLVVRSKLIQMYRFDYGVYSLRFQKLCPFFWQLLV